MGSQESSNLNCDVLVIGGGPAGSTCSSFLHDKGWNVVVLEKEHHPRFHIGESLLPMTLPILEKLGLKDEIEQIGITKYGAEFNFNDEQGSIQTFYFDLAMNKDHPPSAFEVRRSEFDAALFRNAGRKGVDIREGVKVTDVAFSPDQVLVTAKTEEGEAQHWRAKFLIDATGRDTFMSRRNKLKQKSTQHNSAAIFGHFENVERRTGKDEGNISIYWFEHGWFWLIPLKDGMMSVGAVCYPEYLKTREGPVEDFLWQTIRLSPGVTQRMKDARLVGEARATGNFSYNASRMHGRKGENYLLIGDAYAFIDPVFSSGVHLAMSGAMKAADTIDACLRHPKQAQQLLKQHQQQITRALKTFSWLIHRFNSPAIYQLFQAPNNRWRIQEAIISLLSGDVYGNTPIQRPLFLFKVIYYLTSIASLPRSWGAYLRRKRNTRLIFTGGTTPQDHLDS
jgi:flavin-dependent dehydrogenase